MSDEVFEMPKRPDRFWRLADHVKKNPGQTRDQLRRGYLRGYAPTTQNMMIQDTITFGLIVSQPIPGQRAHKIMPSPALRRAHFANDNGFMISQDGRFIGPEAEQAETLFRIAA